MARDRARERERWPGEYKIDVSGEHEVPMLWLRCTGNQ